jgi:hypothetical protein
MQTRGRAENTERVWAWRPTQALLLVCMFAGLLLAHVPAAHALKAIAIATISIASRSPLSAGLRGTRRCLRSNSAGGRRRPRTYVRAPSDALRPAWFVFALTNTTDKAVALARRTATAW